MAYSDEQHDRIIDELWVKPALRNLAESSPLLSLAETVPYRRKRTRRERLTTRVHSLRERAALRIAPWLNPEDYW